jgi:uncharacterized phage-like protein YoqJ
LKPGLAHLPVAVTGHRYVPADDMAWYRSELRRVFEKLEPSAVFSGMALGVDQEAAQVALGLRLALVAVVPYPGQDARWPAPAQERYRELLGQAEETVMVSGQDPVGRSEYVAMLFRRDDVLVELSEVVVACWSGRASGGAWHTMKTAERLGRPLVLIQPGHGTVLRRQGPGTGAASAMKTKRP